MKVRDPVAEKHLERDAIRHARRAALRHHGGHEGKGTRYAETRSKGSHRHFKHAEQRYVITASSSLVLLFIGQRSPCQAPKGTRTRYAERYT